MMTIWPSSSTWSLILIHGQLYLVVGHRYFVKLMLVGSISKYSSSVQRVNLHHGRGYQLRRVYGESLCLQLTVVVLVLGLSLISRMVVKVISSTHRLRRHRRSLPLARIGC